MASGADGVNEPDSTNAHPDSMVTPGHKFDQDAEPSPGVPTAVQGPSEPDLLGGAADDEDSAAVPTSGADEKSGVAPASSTRLFNLIRNLGAVRRWRWYRENAKDRSEIWRSHDPEENEASRLPIDENLSVPAFWVTELYTPSTVSGLLEGIRKLGWDRSRSRGDSLAKWMSDVREGRSAGWTSLGLVSPVNDRHFMHDRVAELPPGVKAALPELMSLTPSITALTICFILDDASAMAVNKPLRDDYQTYSSRDPLLRRRDLVGHVLWGRDVRLGRTIHSPRFQRRDAAANCLSRLEADCTRWVEASLPGAFASGLRGGLYPTAMLIVSEQTRPLKDSQVLQAFEGLGIDHEFDSWESLEWPGIRMVLPRGWRGEDLRLRFTGKRSDAFPPERGYPEPESNWTAAQRTDDKVPGLLSRWALSCLLDGYHQMLSAQRDRSAQKTANLPVRDLRRLRNLVRKDVYDILLSSSEIRGFAKSKRGYRYNVLEMSYVRVTAGKPKIELVEQLEQGQIARAKQVADEARLFLSTATASTDITQVISNIRIQRWIGIATVFSLAVAAAALIIAISASR